MVPRSGNQERQNRRGIGRNYWMFAESPENFAIMKEMGLTLFGMGRRFRRRAERMAPNDRVLFYVKGMRKWPASATITSECFEDNSEVFVSPDSNERYPFRIKLRPNIVLDEPDYIDAMLLAPRLDYVRRWEPKDWPLAFFDRLHLLPQKDFRLIEGEMERITRNNRRKSPQRQNGTGREEEPAVVDDGSAGEEEPAAVVERPEDEPAS